MAPVTSTIGSRPFEGQVVAFTGKLSSLGRRDARQLVESLGGEPAEEVNARTTMLIVGGHESPGGDRRQGEGPASEPEKNRQIRRAEEVNARAEGRVRILTEAEFCDLAGVPSSADLRKQYYAFGDIRSMYPRVEDEHARYLEKLGLIQPAVRTPGGRYYSFPDLLVIKQVAGELERGVPLRVVLRTLAAARDGQLALDFQPGRSDAVPAKVVALERRPPLATARAPRPLPHQLSDPQSVLAARYFLEGAAVDTGDEARFDQAAAAYRKALLIDPDLVPALVNLANIRYARDELIEAQALYERAVALEPECFEAHFNLGNIHHDLGRYDDALACYREAVTLNPTYADAHFYLAVTLEKVGHSQEAKPHWRAYQQLAPNGEWVELAREFSE